MKTIWVKLTFAKDTDVAPTMKKIHEATEGVMVRYQTSTEGPL